MQDVLVRGYAFKASSTRSSFHEVLKISEPHLKTVVDVGVMGLAAEELLFFRKRYVNDLEGMTFTDCDACHVFKERINLATDFLVGFDVSRMHIELQDG